MHKPTDYTNGKGIEGYNNEAARDEVISRAIEQGLKQVECAILIEPMTFRLLSSPPKGAIQTGGEYLIEYRGH